MRPVPHEFYGACSIGRTAEASVMVTRKNVIPEESSSRLALCLIVTGCFQHDKLVMHRQVAKTGKISLDDFSNFVF
jgi:hypothetical protein